MVEAKTASGSDAGWDDEPAKAAASKPGRDVILRIQPEADLFRRVIEPRVVFASLPADDIVSIACDLSHVPSLETIDVSDCFMRFVVTMRTELSIEEICSRFDFTLATEEFQIEVLASEAAPAPAPAAAAPAASGEVSGSVAADLSAILAKLGPAPLPSRRPTSSRPRLRPRRWPSPPLRLPRLRPPLPRRLPARPPTMRPPRASAPPSACVSTSTASTS
ncbi:hypothetical protein BSY19_3598 [Bosea sp. RAC05]|nr:hypothetical protein [Bosea sp. RAC05]AOG07752.1 hypothetical protein BSY19_3598 [Bosea sp. RAC05]